jgi:hypothetical protein
LPPYGLSPCLPEGLNLTRSEKTRRSAQGPHRLHSIRSLTDIEAASSETRLPLWNGPERVRGLNGEGWLLAKTNGSLNAIKPVMAYERVFVVAVAKSSPTSSAPRQTSASTIFGAAQGPGSITPSSFVHLPI